MLISVFIINITEAQKSQTCIASIGMLNHVGLKMKKIRMWWRFLHLKHLWSSRRLVEPTLRGVSRRRTLGRSREDRTEDGAILQSLGF